MEQEAPPPSLLPILLQPSFTESIDIAPYNNMLSPTISLTRPACSSSPPLLLQPQHAPDDLVASEEIDWVSLLSGESMVTVQGDHQKPLALHSPPQPTPPPSALVAEASNYNNKDRHKGRGENDKGGHKDHENKSSIRRGSRKAVPPRIAFHTRSTDDVLDDGYKWRKYGQKAVKNSAHPRSYYRCTHHTCNVKKQIQRLSKDTSIVVTTYEGIHNHPCEKLMETLSPLLKQLQFLSRF